MTQVYLTGAALAGRMVARLLRLRVSRALVGEGFAPMIVTSRLSCRGSLAPGVPAELCAAGRAQIEAAPCKPASLLNVSSNQPNRRKVASLNFLARGFFGSARRACSFRLCSVSLRVGGRA